MAERYHRVVNARYVSLVAAASCAPCSCAAPETRTHDGVCISCWALAEKLKRLRKHLEHEPRDDLDRRVQAAFARLIEEGEADQRLRAEQIPIAERMLAEARREDGHG